MCCLSDTLSSSRLAHTHQWSLCSRVSFPSSSFKERPNEAGNERERLEKWKCFSLREEGRMTCLDAAAAAAAALSLLNVYVLVRLPFAFPCSRPHSSLPLSLLILYFGSLASPLLLSPSSSCLHFPVFLFPSSFPLFSGTTLGQNLLSSSLPSSFLPLPPILSPLSRCQLG